MSWMPCLRFCVGDMDGEEGGEARVIGLEDPEKRL